MNVIVVEYEKYETEIRAIRETVFVIEQNVPRDLEFDQLDERCTHAIVYEDEIPIAVGRIDLSKHGKVGRVAVLKEHRRRGAGNLLMHAFENYAREHQQKNLWCNAQISAVRFYSQLGYKTVGDEFLEADIIHVKMEKEISQ